MPFGISWKAIGTGIGIALAPATGGTSLVLSGGAGFLVGGALDEADKEMKREARKDKLAEAQTESQIAALEAAKREREKKQEELDRGIENEKKIEELLENIEQKLQNPDLRADHETEEYLNNQKDFYATQLNDQKKLNKKLRDALEASEKAIQSIGSKNLTSSESNWNLPTSWDEMSLETKLIIVAVIILIIYFMFLRKD
jgi:hypothetical protein